MRRVGAGTASFSLTPADEDGQQEFAGVALLFNSVPGKQTVPRSETWAGAMALNKSGPDVGKWYSDANSVVLGLSAGGAQSTIAEREWRRVVPLF